MNPNKFLHIADLHLIGNLHLKVVEDNIHHFKIKKQILHHIKTLIVEENIGTILIAGDIEARNPDDIYPFFKRWLDLNVRIFIVFGDHDTAQMRKALTSLFQHEPYFYILEEGRLIRDESLNFNVYGLNCEPKQKGFLHDFRALPVQASNKPTIFLTHPYNLPKMKMRELGCEYFATGHIHSFSIEKIDENITLGRPGHLYSYWDGDGKAWPTGGIIGEFNGKNLTLRQILFPVQQTVRFFINPFKTRGERVKFVIENCSQAKGNQLKHIIDGKWYNFEFRADFQGYIEPNRSQLEKFLHKMLMVFKDDLFVTPSDSGKMRKNAGIAVPFFPQNIYLRIKTI